MITYTPEELREAIDLAENAKSTNDLPPYVWARMAMMLAQEVKRLRADDDPRHIRIGESVLPISYREVKRK